MSRLVNAFGPNWTARAWLALVLGYLAGCLVLAAAIITAAVVQ